MTNSLNSKSGFRTDINGLRAWAVAAVVLYHFGIPGFGGGFVGVDVFFVISGYLMTRIIVTGLLEERFSLLQFYAARARRIVPALAVLCLVLLAVGWHTLPSADYQQLSEHVGSSLVFLSNVTYSNEAGYFDAGAHEKWLLHTWSLSVEWQFYVVLPLALLLIWRFSPRKASIKWLMIAMLAASLALAVAESVVNPSSPAAFFRLPARAWEMLAGGLVYLIATKKPTAKYAALLELAGFGLILLSTAAFDADTSWPGGWTLLPVLGTVAILTAARDRSLWTRTRLAQSLGHASYSIYLWHWPVVVALYLYDLQNAPLAIVLGLGLTIILGYVSYRLIEVPTRRWMSRIRGRAFAAAIAAVFASVIGPAAAVYIGGGFDHRFPEIERIAAEEQNRNQRIAECHATKGGMSPSCMYGGEMLGAIVLGDSHAISIITAVEAAFVGTPYGVMEWTNSGCPTLFGAERHPSRSRRVSCNAFNQWALERLAEVPRHVPLIIVNRNEYYVLGPNERSTPPRPIISFGEPQSSPTPAFLGEYAERLVRTACTFATERDVYLMRPIPEMGVHVPQAMARAAMRGSTTRVSISLDEYRARHAITLAAQDEAQRRCGVKILDPLPYLCPDGRCWGDLNGRPLYFDDDHLSEYGNRLLVPLFATLIPQPMEAARKPPEQAFAADQSVH